MSSTLCPAPFDPIGTLDATGPTYDVVPLRPLHALELARLELDHREVSGGTPFATYGRTRRWVMHLLARRTADVRAFVVTDHATPLGIAVLDDLRRDAARSGQIAVWVDRSRRRNGAGTAAVAALCGVAADAGLHRLEAAVLPDDAPASGLLAANGFLPVGLARDYRLVAGRWRDHVLYERVGA